MSRVKQFLKDKYITFIRDLKYYYYKLFIYHRVLNVVKRRGKKKIFFFVISTSMWKSNDLFTRLLADSEFEPYIIPFLYPHQTLERQKQIQSDIINFCKKKKFPFIEGKDFNTGRIIDVVGLHPDIIFYAQPYNVGYDELKIEKLWKSSLFAYIPYCLNLETDPIYYNGLYQQICWKSYSASNLNKEFEGRLLHSRGKNLVTVGHSFFDMIENIKNPNEEIWRDNNHIKTRVIWAPHHSINPEDIGYSNFLEIAEDMVKLAEKYCNKIFIVFKPHPLLKSKLNNNAVWGQNRTNSYYSKWQQMPNTAISEGDYADLFITSDCMIHDSASFTCEYIYTEHPVLFVTKDSNKHRGGLNILGQKCFDLHYKGKNILDIESFIVKVKNGIDEKKQQRHEFKNKYLRQDNVSTVGDKIYNDIKSALKY